MNKPLRLARRIKELSQKELAKRAGISYSMYQSYEYGISAPSVFIAQRIAHALDTSVDEIFKCEEQLTL